jgi:hypothetical protein
MYTYEQAGIISPGLYRIEGTGLGNLVKLGDVVVTEFASINTLMISFALADLMADPDFSAWYDPSDPVLGVAAFTQRITLLGGAAEADRSPGGRCYLREFSISPGSNQLPVIGNPVFQGEGSMACAQVEYADADGNCPVLSQVVFDGSLSFPMYPLSLDYGSTVTYSTDSGIEPLAGDSWDTAVFRFSDDQDNVIEHEVTATGTETGPPHAGGVHVSVAPNPFNALTVIGLDLERGMHVSIGVYDARGARVSTLLDGRLGPGHSEIHWRAMGEGGRGMESGVYFIRVDAGGMATTLKVVLLR